MITPSFSLTATERVLPRLALDFTTANLDPRVTFTRADNTATVINSSGLVAVVNADIPRFEYDPLTLVSKGLLIEEARTNLVLQSQEIGSPWTLANLGRTLNTDISPDGTVNADTINGNTNNNVHTLNQSISSSGTLTLSVFAKLKVGSKFLTIGFSRATTHYATATFDLTNGTVTQTLIAGYAGAVTAGVVQIVNGYYRVYMTATTDTISQIGIGVSNTSTFVNGGRGFDAYVGNTTDNIVIYGAQLEAGDFPTSYIPTTTTSLTRNADVATITGTNFSSWYNATEGSASVESIQNIATGIRTSIQFDDGGANNIIALRGNTTNPELYIKNTTDQAQIDAGTIAANITYKLSGSWSTNDCAASVNSGAPVLDGDATIPTTNQARIGSDGTNYLNGSIKSIEFYADRLLNSNLQVVSSPAGYRSIIVPVLRDTIIS
jgi:hypothetical protein